MIKNRCVRLRRYFIIATGIFAVALTGCSHSIGGRPFPIEIDSDPSGESAYLIPNTDWVAKGIGNLDPSSSEFKTLVNAYRVTDGKTPVTTYAPSDEMWVVVNFGGQYVVSRQPVMPGQVDRINMVAP